MKEVLKRHYAKILIVLLVVLYFGTCTKSCNKSNELRIVKTELDSVYYANENINDSIQYLNHIISMKDVELVNKNTQIEQLSNTINSLLRKNTTNNIRVIVPEQKTELKNE